MAVIQISKIQVRRGLQDDLPQLAGGEFGWSVDTRKLYIGNGTLSEGASQIGNTEILTAISDVLSAISSYNFLGDESGYTSLSGATASAKTYRTLQHKIDEQISARDFGATGDGITDDTVALQRAINQVFPSLYYNIVGVRRVLHIPAGTYIITSDLQVPPYADIRGDGPNSTIIQQMNADNVLSFVAGGGSYPNNSSISALQLKNVQTTQDIARVISAENILFDRVRFQGNITAPTSGTGTAGAVIYNGTGNTRHVNFKNCEFANSTWGVVTQGYVTAVSISGSKFDTLYQGIIGGANVGSPQGVKVTSSLFSNIARQAIYSYDDSSITSAFNVFQTIGYGNATAVVSATASYNVITWNTPNNYSIGDVFERTTTDQKVVPLISTVTDQSGSLTQVSTAGAVQDTPGATITLTDGTTANTTLVLSTLTPAAQIDYRVTRSNGYRIGTMHVSHYNGTVVYDDEYSESSSLGVTLNFIGNTTTNTATLSYTTTASANTDAYIKYTIRSFV
jgi:hypothetical protein